MQTSLIDYQDNNIGLQGYLAFDDTFSEPRPVVLVAHDWSGRNEFACKKAEKLAELGYIGFALDMFGKGIIGHTTEEKMQLITPFMNDRQLLQRRILAAFEKVKNLPFVAATKIAIIGFCFGGLCALDLARSGADIKGVVSFHGLLNSPNDIPNKKIKAKVLALHGHNDPMVKPDQVALFQKEMTDASVDWQMHIYGHTLHAFTNPQANDHNFGTVYEAKADRRSWIAMTNFLREIFND